MPVKRKSRSNYLSSRMISYLPPLHKTLCPRAMYTHGRFVFDCHTGLDLL